MNFHKLNVDGMIDEVDLSNNSFNRTRHFKPTTIMSIATFNTDRNNIFSCFLFTRNWVRDINKRASWFQKNHLRNWSNERMRTKVNCISSNFHSEFISGKKKSCRSRFIWCVQIGWDHKSNVRCVRPDQCLHWIAANHFTSSLFAVSKLLMRLTRSLKIKK